jgi:hypothetical protein
LYIRLARHKLDIPKAGFPVSGKLYGHPYSGTKGQLFVYRSKNVRRTS